MTKVNQMNLDTGRDVLLVSSLFALLPHDFVAKIGVSGLILGILYFLNGKLPKSD